MRLIYAVFVLLLALMASAQCQQTAEEWYSNGVALETQGKYDEAIKAYDEAIRLDPNNADAVMAAWALSKLEDTRDVEPLIQTPKDEVSGVRKSAVIKDLLVRMEISPSQIPTEEMNEIVRLNITMSNTGKEIMRDVRLLDVFPMGRFIKWARPQRGEANVTDPYNGQPSDAINAFLNGSMLRWNINKLEPDKSARLNVEVELLYPMDSGWEERLDTGATAAYEGFSYNHTQENVDDGPAINLTYPTWIYSGKTNISWNLNQEASYTALNLYSPEKRSGSIKITDIKPEKLYEVRVQMLTPGKWIFNIEAGEGYAHRTKNCTIDVRSNIEALNITAISHIKSPQLFLVAAKA